MKMGRMDDVAVGAAGDIAGALVDPRQGLSRLRASVSGRALVTVALGLLIGYLVARSRRRG